MTGTCRQGHSPVCPPTAFGHWHSGAEWVPVLPSSCSPTVCGRGRGWLALPPLPRDFCPAPRDTAGWLRQQLAGQRRKPAAADRSQRTTSLPHGHRGRALVNDSLCWQRLTVPQLLAQALYAKECQEFPCSQAGISEQDASGTFLVSSCGLLCSSLRSSQASSQHHRALRRQHTYSHSHIVFCRHAVPGGHW